MENNNVPLVQSTLEEQLAGLDLVPHPMFNNGVTEDQLREIAQNLREQISKSIKDMKALSQARISEEVSEPNYALAIVPLSVVSLQEFDRTPNTASKKKGRKITTKVVGEISVSYELPEICYLNNIDLDNLPSREQASNTNKRCQFSFIERLENWSLEQRERSNRMRDVYYHHTRSGASFRSITEVVNFLMFEAYPPKSQSKTNKQKEAMLASGTPSASPGKTKRKYCGRKKQKKLKMDHAMVTQFFIEISQNMMNMSLYEPVDSSEDEI